MYLSSSSSSSRWCICVAILFLLQYVDCFSTNTSTFFEKNKRGGGFTVHSSTTSSRRTITSSSTLITTRKKYHNQEEAVPRDETIQEDDASSRRKFLGGLISILSTSGVSIFLDPSVAFSMQEEPPSIQPPTMAATVAAAQKEEPSSSALSRSSADAKITSKIFIQLKGLPTDESNDIPQQEADDIITIGLFELDAPQPTAILKQLVSNEGYPAKCKPREIRTLQREQLEANKVYNTCIEIEDSKGVNYDLSTVWRVVKDERIDLGAVSGKFVSRESPMFQGGNEMLKHDVEGVVSVRKGNDGGFGFTIYPGKSGASNSELDQDNIVVGRVIGGMNVVKRLNELPVVQSPIGGSSSNKRLAPSRACRYGSAELYCNEFKPLKKILIQKTGLVKE